MCDKQHFDELEERVDEHERRLAVLESGVNDFREETRSNFNDVKEQFKNLYAERAEWGKLGRAIVERVVKWLLWLLPVLIGLRYGADYLAK